MANKPTTTTPAPATPAPATTTTTPATGLPPMAVTGLVPPAPATPVNRRGRSTAPKGLATAMVWATAHRQGNGGPCNVGKVVAQCMAGVQWQGTTYTLAYYTAKTQATNYNQYVAGVKGINVPRAVRALMGV